MEHLLRYAVLALLDQPQADLRDIVRLYVDKEFRKAVVAGIRNEQVRAFWTSEIPEHELCERDRWRCSDRQQAPAPTRAPCRPRRHLRTRTTIAVPAHHGPKARS
ncbi:MAG: hypothetical protein IPO97_13255 [Sphingomonadales bacterium]|nr:hypothetical protein [Sphingomonadales bacterium]